MVPLVVAPYGGKLPDGTTVQRTFAATRSVEYDAVLLAGSPTPAALRPPDALVVRDSKARRGRCRSLLDPRVVLLLQECFRHAKAIGAWGAGVDALEARRHRGRSRRAERRRPGSGLRAAAHRPERAPRLGAVRHGAGLSLPRTASSAGGAILAAGTRGVAALRPARKPLHPGGGRPRPDLPPRLGCADRRRLARPARRGRRRRTALARDRAAAQPARHPRPRRTRAHRAVATGTSCSPRPASAGSPASCSPRADSRAAGR